ncbi:MAG: DUF3576 domain-containing protein [Alphaproteobacteria bacterium]|nr:DUF3576 domain-containing protein [Alphaproteobacteria bacterium]
MTFNRSRPGILRICAVLALGTLTACEGIETERANPESYRDSLRRDSGKLFGDINLLGGSDDSAAANSGIGVNGFLWRASLDTLSFLPLSSADPFGGVIITDWYAPPESPSERFKVTVYILGRELRSDGLRVAVFRQKKEDGNEWLDAATGDNAATSLENAILTRARELRVARADG